MPSLAQQESCHNATRWQEAVDALRKFEHTNHPPLVVKTTAQLPASRNESYVGIHSVLQQPQYCPKVTYDGLKRCRQWMNICDSADYEDILYNIQGTHDVLFFLALAFLPSDRGRGVTTYLLTFDLVLVL